MDRPLTSSSAGRHHSHQQRRTYERSVDFICRVKYGNTLPDLPFEPKFLQSPFISLNRFIGYKPSSLEKCFKYELLTEPDLNVKIDLIDPMTYHCEPDEKTTLDPIDEQLLEDESASQLNTRRSIQHRKVVPWMRKTEYISTEFSRYGIGQTGAERPDTKIGYGMKNRIKDESFEYKGRDSQIAAIQRTFSEVQKPVRHHYSKKGVTAVEEMPIFPDFELWRYPFAQVIFDADPLPYCKESRQEKLVEAIIRGMVDMEGNQFVGFFAPLDEALQQRTIDDEEDFGSYKEGTEYHYKLEREYNWAVQNISTKGYVQENYFLIRRGSMFNYIELDTKVKLTRRSKRGLKNTILSIVNRQMNNKEISVMTNRTNQLFGLQEEEAVDEQEEDEEQQSREEIADEDGREEEEENESKDEDKVGDDQDEDGSEISTTNKADGGNTRSQSPVSSKAEESEEDQGEKGERDGNEKGGGIGGEEQRKETEEERTSEEEDSSSESEEEESSEEEEDDG
ncbi:hypothetical protein niasHS_003595 [Heterodera schachtii]|uniref:RNA polymerase II-associated factor 1 homolog n=1 Tax=Heterodera schachtii TaxID=97005 RepID=A0ABD2KGZ1_HETSC